MKCFSDLLHFLSFLRIVGIPGVKVGVFSNGVATSAVHQTNEVYNMALDFCTATDVENFKAGTKKDVTNMSSTRFLRHSFRKEQVYQLAVALQVSARCVFFCLKRAACGEVNCCSALP